MPPKVKITKDDIISATVDIVRKNGENGINARTVASELGCSTQPIFSNFETMEKLQEAVEISIYNLYLSFLQKEAASGKYPQYKSFGMAYIRFAEEEPELFKFIFMCDRKGEKFKPTFDFETSVEMIMQANGICKEKAELIHTEMWIFVHGIATMLATSYLTLPWDLISNMLTDIYQGLRMSHLQGGKDK